MTISLIAVISLIVLRRLTHRQGLSEPLHGLDKVTAFQAPYLSGTGISQIDSPVATYRWHPRIYTWRIIRQQIGPERTINLYEERKSSMRCNAIAAENAPWGSAPGDLFCMTEEDASRGTREALKQLYKRESTLNCHSSLLVTAVVSVRQASTHVCTLVQKT